MPDDVQDGLFAVAAAAQPAVRVLMALNPQYYDLIWAGQKRHEFRRRYLAGQPTTWFVYLTAPVSRLAAIVDLDPAVIDSPARVADLAEQARPGNGASVLAYLQDLERGFALPIRRVREYPGLGREQLVARLGGFHPPQGYTLIDRHPALAQVCDTHTAEAPIRTMVLEHPALVT